MQPPIMWKDLRWSSIKTFAVLPPCFAPHPPNVFCRTENPMPMPMQPHIKYSSLVLCIRDAISVDCSPWISLWDLNPEPVNFPLDEVSMGPEMRPMNRIGSVNTGHTVRPVRRHRRSAVLELLPEEKQGWWRSTLNWVMIHYPYAKLKCSEQSQPTHLETHCLPGY